MLPTPGGPACCCGRRDRSHTGGGLASRHVPRPRVVAAGSQPSPVVSEYLDASPDVQAARFRHAFAVALGRAGELPSFPAERVAEVCGEEELHLLRLNSAAIADFARQVAAARTPSRCVSFEEAREEYAALVAESLDASRVTRERTAYFLAGHEAALWSQDWSQTGGVDEVRKATRRRCWVGLAA